MGFIDSLSKQREAELILHHSWPANTQVEARAERLSTIL